MLKNLIKKDVDNFNSTIIYSFIISKIKKKREPFSNIVKREKVKKVFRLYFRLPKEMDNKLLNELERHGFIKINDKQNIKLLK